MLRVNRAQQWQRFLEGLLVDISSHVESLQRTVRAPFEQFISIKHSIIENIFKNTPPQSVDLPLIDELSLLYIEHKTTIKIIISISSRVISDIQLFIYFQQMYN